MKAKVWLWSLMMLRTDGLVDGVKWIPTGANSADMILTMNARKSASSIRSSSSIRNSLEGALL